MKFKGITVFLMFTRGILIAREVIIFG